MEEQLAAKGVWTASFPDQITFPTSPLPVKALDPKNQAIDLEGHSLHAINAGQSDTDHTSFLWVPDLKMAVTGDIVYNGAYSFLVESLTTELRQGWIHAIQKIKALNPEHVVVGHKRPGAVDGAWALDAKSAYLELWEELVKEARDARDLFEMVTMGDPGKLGEAVLWWSSLQQFSLI